MSSYDSEEIRTNRPILSGASSTDTPKTHSHRVPSLRNLVPTRTHISGSINSSSSNRQTATSRPIHSCSNSPYIPFLERVRKANGQVPERFKVKPSKRTVSPLSGRCTIPKAPRLLTEARAKSYPKPLTPPAPEPFRARPVNPKILHSKGNLGVPRIIKPKTTIARSPNLGRKRPRDTPTEERRDISSRCSSHRNFIQYSGHKYTIPHPFTFASDKIAEAKMQEFDRKVRQQILEEERARRFKAQPLPSFSPKPLPVVPQKPLTQPRPFFFAVEARISRHQRLMQQKINEEGRKQSEKGPPGFRARPAPKLTFLPSVRKSNKPPIIPQPFTLHSEKRVQLRRQFDADLQEKNSRKEKDLQERLQAQKEREELQVRCLREQLVHKARPVPNYQFFLPKKSARPLTSPHTPNFAKRRKL